MDMADLAESTSQRFLRLGNSRSHSRTRAHGRRRHMGANFHLHVEADSCTIPEFSGFCADGGVTKNSPLG